MRRACKQCGKPVPEKLRAKGSAVCYTCRNRRYSSPGIKGKAKRPDLGRATRRCTSCGTDVSGAPTEMYRPLFVCTDCKRLDESLIRIGLTDLEWEWVKHAARLMAEYQLFQIEQRAGRAPGRRLKKSEQPETADEFIVSRCDDVRRQITLLSRTCEYATIKGWFTSNAYNKTDWARHMAKQTHAKLSA